MICTGIVVAMAVLASPAEAPAKSEVIAEEGDALVGLWLTEDEEARIEITRRRERAVRADNKEGKTEPTRYNGRIAWLKRPNYSKWDEEAGKPFRDRQNPDPTKRNRPQLGLEIMDGFQYLGKNKWGKGTIYDVESGKTYKCQITLVEPEAGAESGEKRDPGPVQLKLRGYVGHPMFGRSTTWSRYVEPEKAQVPAEPAE